MPRGVDTAEGSPIAFHATALFDVFLRQGDSCLSTRRSGWTICPGTKIVLVTESVPSREVLALEQVKLGLAELEFRYQLLVFLEWALRIRQGELGALRWLSCGFDNMSISVQHSSYWRRGGNLKSTKTEASAKLLPMHPSLKHSLQEWRS